MKQGQTEVKKFVPPAVEQNTTFIRYKWETWGVGVIADRFNDEGHAELHFYRLEDNAILLPTKASLLDTRAMTSIANRLEKNLDDLPWTDILTYVAAKTLQVARQGEPVLKLGTKPETMRITYRLWPVIEEGEPTTIYCPAGYGKSYLATYIACLVQFDKFGLPDCRQAWAPIQGNVLYLDYESSYEKHQRRVWAVKRGLGIEDEGTFLYRRCVQPFVKDLPQIQKLVADNDIRLLITDSQIAASSYGPDPAQVASQYYNAGRSLGLSHLTVDHVSKEEMKSPIDANSVGPYGSVVKGQRARQTFELRRHQAPDQDYIDLDLIHRKCNEGRLLDHIGIRISFINDSNGYLDKVTFASLDVATHPVFGAARSLPQRLDDALEEGSMTVKQLAELMPDKNETQIRVELNRNKNRYIKLANDSWGRLRHGL